MGKVFEDIADLVVVLLRTWNEDIYKFVKKRIKENVTENVHMYRNTLSTYTLEKPWRWIMSANEKKDTEVLIIVPEGFYSVVTDELYEKIQATFAKYVEGCYFFKTRDLEETYCGEALRSKLAERMDLLEKEIKIDLEEE